MYKPGMNITASTFLGSTLMPPQYTPGVRTTGLPVLLFIVTLLKLHAPTPGATRYASGSALGSMPPTGTGVTHPPNNGNTTPMDAAFRQPPPMFSNALSITPQVGAFTLAFTFIPPSKPKE